MQMTGMSADYEKVRYKFFIEAGWGPDLRVFPEFTERVWKGMIKTPGKILSVTPCFSTFGQSIDNQTDNELDFTLTTHSMDEEVQQLLKDRYGFTEYYRSDLFWHNAYKFRVHKASLDSWYTQEVQMDMDLVDGDEIRCRILEKNGSCAWTSPIFIEE